MLNFIPKTLLSAFRSRETLIAENLALRQQIEVLQRNSYQTSAEMARQGVLGPAQLDLARVSPEVRELIRQMSSANPLWGAPRIHGELLKLGIDVGQTTVSRYMVKPDRPPSQSWRTFLANHATDIASIDFFTVPTAIFGVIYVLLVLGNARRRVDPSGMPGSCNHPERAAPAAGTPGVFGLLPPEPDPPWAGEGLPGVSDNRASRVR